MHPGNVSPLQHFCFASPSFEIPFFLEALYCKFLGRLSSNIQRGGRGGFFPEAKTASPNPTPTLSGWASLGFSGPWNFPLTGSGWSSVEPLTLFLLASATPSWSIALVSSLTRRKLHQPRLRRSSSLPKAPKPLPQTQSPTAGSTTPPLHQVAPNFLSQQFALIIPYPRPFAPQRSRQTLMSRPRPLCLPLLPGAPPGPSPWTLRSPSAASAPKRSSEASRARSTPHRLGPHSCAMTGSTRQRRRSLKRLAVRVSRSGAGRPLPRTRTGEPRVQVLALPEGLRGAALALPPASRGLPLVGPSVRGRCVRYAHDASVRLSLVPCLRRHFADSPTVQTPTTPTSARWAVEPMAGASKQLPKVAGRGGGGAHLARRSTQSAGAGSRHLGGSPPPPEHLRWPRDWGKGAGLASAPPGVGPSR